MLYAWGFDRIGVVAGDLYFQDPDPLPGQESPERGVRLEIRLLEKPAITGSIYAAQPIVVGRPVWRADLLESVDSAPGSHDRFHHHPHFRGWEPGLRRFEAEINADPIGWLKKKLGNLTELLAGADIDRSEVGPDDDAALAGAAEEITSVVESLLARVHKGELAVATDEAGPAARVSWL